MRFEHDADVVAVTHAVAALRVVLGLDVAVTVVDFFPDLVAAGLIVVSLVNVVVDVVDGLVVVALVVAVVVYVVDGLIVVALVVACCDWSCCCCSC